MEDSLALLTTEQRNLRSKHMDQMSTGEILTVMNKEDQRVAEAVQTVLPQVEEAIKYITTALKKGGRLFYVGAGTSGRLGILDASECPPTFMVPPDKVQAVMAGGGDALARARENTEDNEQQGKMDLKDKQLTDLDVVVGITASGRTPYPIGALKYAGEKGAYTISLSCNPLSEISAFAETSIEVVVGPEVLTGSTRLKAATAHKMILNMISTTTMVHLGKVYENLMVDVHASNHKLRERAKRIIVECTQTSYEKADQTLVEADFQVKPAIVMLQSGVSYEKALNLLDKNEGHLRQALRTQDE
ncbi:N-acetylmuramic acid 6-phosphate etherase [Halobacillus halophilus]|uniref:N-acetylmuramic acid 6-phosphate etherase n=1 Tax=Halobacillus halophilus (strain ATCC 35676 / DSM 2266 / JCM 20832 / KCTC 3685 / LMG 17431 / NBRC 102448 / NCIMB 2269) TaxID=866895 RepID=I0JQS1_HALH3|nr:N-acetylmuramic acid 6-phosphate etherase [Halobacillus halophilus]ASF40500.1 N-acetylmuramic acid 6-phosphate etherase [Halobacillus halophilus]CCG46491.1 N-acetylmuramic acid-6-phosphate etherase [Halobacillus halophilus DSM 2266]